MSLARPVATIFEVDRMRVISAAEIDPESLKDAPEGLRALSWTGPRILAAATPRTREEALQAIDLAMGGLDISNLPKNWRPYESQNTSAWNRAKPAPDWSDAIRRRTMRWRARRRRRTFPSASSASCR